jgi:predicted RNA-binding protein associated with RNAse of E/G family
MLHQELLALAVAEAEEYYVDILERHLISKSQFRIADESFVDIAHQIAGVALAVGKDDLCLRVVQQQADQFTACVAGSA